MRSKSILSATVIATAMVAATIVSGTVSASASDCTDTGLMRDNMPMTAAVMGGLTGPVDIDAAGCTVGIYIDAANPGSVTGVTVHGATYFGILVNGASADVKNSTVRDIGDTPLNGAQHGNAIVYLNGATGEISGNTVTHFQKNGITVSGKDANNDVTASPTTSATVLNNVVTGEGQIDYIAQNGIQISFGASALVRGNTVSGFWYTPTTNTSCGLLFYQSGGVKQQANSLSANEANLCNVGRGGGNFSA